MDRTERISVTLGAVRERCDGTSGCGHHRDVIEQPDLLVGNDEPQCGTRGFFSLPTCPLRLNVLTLCVQSPAWADVIAVVSKQAPNSLNVRNLVDPVPLGL